MVTLVQSEDRHTLGISYPRASSGRAHSADMEQWDHSSTMLRPSRIHGLSCAEARYLPYTTVVGAFDCFRGPICCLPFHLDATYTECVQLGSM